jgi:hypothetical protein
MGTSSSFEAMHTIGQWYSSTFNLIQKDLVITKVLLLDSFPSISEQYQQNLVELGGIEPPTSTLPV